MKHTIRFSLVTFLLLLTPAVASAGFWGTITQAAKKLDVKTPSQGAVPSSSGELRSGNSATTGLNGLTDYNGCMAQTTGAQEKLNAEALERKLRLHPQLARRERRNIQEDIKWLNATAAGQNIPSPDPRNPQRYLLEMSDADQQEVHAVYAKFANEVRQRCEAQYGGMSQFSNPSGWRHAPIDTHVPFPSLSSTEPVSHRRGPPKGNHCIAVMQDLRWNIMADMMEQKMARQHNLSARQKRGWEEDIALVRHMAHSNGLTLPQSPDPSNPTRYLQRLDENEQMQLNQTYAQRSRQALSNCMNAGISPKQRQMNSELAAMHEARRARREAERNGVTFKSDLDLRALRRIKGEWGHQVTCEHNSVTCGNGLDQMANCMHQTKNYFYRVAAAALQQKLDKEHNLSARDRSSLRVDIAKVRRAIETGHVAGPDARSSEHWMTWLSQDDQQAVQQINSRYSSAVHKDCDARFASLSHYSGTGGR